MHQNIDLSIEYLTGNLLNLAPHYCTKHNNKQAMGAWAGIAGFHKWFSSAFPTAVKRAHSRQEDLFDHVCIDMNQVTNSS